MKHTIVQNKPIFSMAQPAALPGSCRYAGGDIRRISDRLLEEVRVLSEGGVDGVILQNFLDGPVKQSAAPETAAYLTRLACDIKRSYPALLLGILVCWDGPASVLVAEAAGADFVRVEHVYCGAELTAAGILEGQCVEVQQTKRRLGASVPIFADVYEPHSVPLLPRPLEDAAADCVYGGLADGLFVCGKSSSESIAY
ncbi:MAG: BtpA/SgcQ family protein, partial [Pseudoflavonifractor sp.]